MLTPPLPTDRAVMAEALRLAACVDRRPWPNPPVGSLVVRDGQVVGRGAHRGAGTDHAEVVALREAGTRARGGTLYCTLEPCNHHGRTPPCTPAIAASGVSRVVVAVRDPNPGVTGGGIEQLTDAGVAVTLGVRADEALELIWPFVVTRAFQRPFVCLKTATSLDSRFAPAFRQGRAPVYLTGEAARREVHVLRRWFDVVLVGGETFRADAPRLDTRLVTADDPCPSIEPMPAVATSTAECVAWAGRTHVVFTSRPSKTAGLAPASLPARTQGRSPGAGVAAEDETTVPGGGIVVECDECEGGLEPASIVERLASLNAHTLLLEGGPRLAASFLSAGFVDRWISYTAPVVLGDGPGWPRFGAPGVPGPKGQGRDPAWTLTRVARCGADVKMVWDRVPFHVTLEALASPSRKADVLPEPAGGARCSPV